ncbi:unnamed protein product [Rhizophagus irregularis]|nr:unnamed protein product [Rhizophagus irregularis]
MTEQEQSPNNRLTLSNTEMEKESETHIKSGRPQSEVWKHFDRGESKDKPFTGESVITQDWKKVEKLVANQPEMNASLINEVISLAFIMCRIPFRVRN